MGDTSISWTDKTWNFLRGCSRVSEGCRNCYAERIATRFGGEGMPYEGLVTIGKKHPQTGRPTTGVRGKWTGKIRFLPEVLAKPLRWKKPQKIFVNSMSDLFHENVTNEQIAAAFGVMAACPHHTFQILTKRPKRALEWFAWLDDCGHEQMAIESISHVASWEDRAMAADKLRSRLVTHAPWPLPNVWLGVSVENQEAADERIPILLETPAAVRFLSCEPLLGPIDISEYFDPCSVPCGEEPWPPLDWVIAGCESGPGRRGCDVAWLRSLRDQCDAADAAFFLKQSAGDGYVDPVTVGVGSFRKGNGAVIELPYLDGFQHAAFPRTA